MNKTILVALLFLMSAIACQQDTKTKYLNHQTSTAATEELNPYSSLLPGEWLESCPIFVDGAVLMRNACPHWKFTSNGILYINNGDIKKWRMKKDTLYLDPTSVNDKNQDIHPSRYQITRVKGTWIDSNSIVLELKDIQWGSISNLVKQESYMHLHLPALNKK